MHKQLGGIVILGLGLIRFLYLLSVVCKEVSEQVIN